MRDEDAIESEIKAKGLNAPRLTPQAIDDAIVAEYSGRASDLFKNCPALPALECLTICVLVLRNGYIVTGESACASPENFNEQLGHKIARDNARNKIWALEGYLLKERLHDSMPAGAGEGLSNQISNPLAQNANCAETTCGMTNQSNRPAGAGDTRED